MNRRSVIQGLMLGSAGLTSLGASQAQGQPVATLEQFPQLWSRVEFSYLNKPATVIRVPKPEANRSRVLEINPNFFLAGYLRECPHNGCEAKHFAPDPTRIVCPCHGSRFWARDGSLEAGVANEDLAGLRLEQAESSIFVLGLI